MKIKSAIVTGATGVMGLALVRLLISQRILVTVIARPESRRIHKLPHSELLGVVIADLDGLASMDLRADAFFHLGWDNGTKEAELDPMRQAESIVDATIAAALAAKAGCSVFVGVGSRAEYGPVYGVITGGTGESPTTPYGVAKLAAGKLSRIACEGTCVRHCWCRIISVYGPGDRGTSAISYVIDSLLRGESPLLTKGDQTWDYMYEDDCAEALYAVARSGVDGKTYVVGSGDYRSIRSHMLEIGGLIDPSIVLAFGAVGSKDDEPMDAYTRSLDLRDDTGFTRSITFRDGIKKTIEARKMMMARSR